MGNEVGSARIMGDEISNAAGPNMQRLQRCSPRSPYDDATTAGACRNAEADGSDSNGSDGHMVATAQPSNFGDALPRIGPSVMGSLLGTPARTVANSPGVLKVISHLGTGRFSYVFECRVVGEAEPVAVKLCTQDQKAVLAREASLLLGLCHVSLVKLLRVIEGPPVMMFLELCRGGELQELLHGAQYAERIKTVNLHSRVHTLLQVVCAVAYLHSKMIVHRDINSANCFMTRTPSEVPEDTVPPIKLGDLGLSRMVDGFSQLSDFTAGMRSFKYSAPEVLEGDTYGFPIDIYSCGILAHEVITGHVPYESPGASPRTDIALILAIVEGERPVLEDMPDDPHRHRMQAIIAASWSTDPSKRPTASDLTNKLRQFLWSMT